MRSILARAAGAWQTYVGGGGTAAISRNAAVIAALVPAALSFRFVEEPIRRRRVWPSPRATAAIGVACVVVPLACAIGLVTAADRAWGDRDLLALREAITPNHIDLTSLCASYLPLGDSDRAPCIWPAASSQTASSQTASSPTVSSQTASAQAAPAQAASARGTVLLIGDSNAGHLSEPFIAAAHALGYDAQLATAGGCPFLLRPTYLSEQCREFVEGSANAIARRAPGYAAVVVSNASVGDLDGLLAPQFIADATPAGASDREGAIRGWTASVVRTIDAITPHAPVIVVGAVPQFFNLPGCLRPTLFAGPAPWCGQWAKRMVTSLRGDIITAERTAALAHGATYLDTGARICTERVCSAFIDGTLVYRDGAQLSISGSMHFQPDFEAALSTAITRTRTNGARAAP
jgi:hypothetical protein